MEKYLDKESFNDALNKYGDDLIKYYDKNWFLRLITRKPKEPQKENFYRYEKTK